MKREIILHVFQWKIKDIIKNLEEIKDSGYTAIQLTPIQPCKKGAEWWTFYQPLGFRIGNRTGTKEDLIELCAKAKKLNIKTIVDIVLRHCANAGGGEKEIIPHVTVDEILKSNPKFWTNAKTTTDYENRHAMISGAFGLPMLDYNNLKLQEIYIKFLTELKECGVNGFRIDMGKHFGLTDEGSNFWNNVFGRFKDMFNYAECIECETKLLDKYTKFINVLTDGYATDKSKMVIFIESHDTYYTWGYTKKMTDKMIKDEWNILLKSNRESHVLFFARSYSNVWKSEEIKRSNFIYK